MTYVVRKLPGVRMLVCAPWCVASRVGPGKMQVALLASSGCVGGGVLTPASAMGPVLRRRLRVGPAIRFSIDGEELL